MPRMPVESLEATIAAAALASSLASSDEISTAPCCTARAETMTGEACLIEAGCAMGLPAQGATLDAWREEFAEGCRHLLHGNAVVREVTTREVDVATRLCDGLQIVTCVLDPTEALDC
eukprot:CAMPEP_0115735882 /NCGR_PEP_ID=MMETSP0272-20121206/86960_1 /TAXON_ID=71861 /ORGANISM="Scrippsiella trochoidea, Strain CCMP3099" /LENGTH=117 /DNA_ID=CAMNT_0003180025 /DNA_START=1 /DNA_END=354 /DNA_ORIENTATION=-